jgi:hypothetical protein
MNEINQIRAFLNLAIDQELQATNEGERPEVDWADLLEGAKLSGNRLILKDGRSFEIIVQPW